MKLVFYSSNTNFFDGNIFHYYNYPSNKDFWEKILEKHPDWKLIFVTEAPGMFLIDIQNMTLSNISDKITYFLITPTAKFIKNLEPDLVIAATFWVTPFDWLPISDSLIAEELSQMGIKVICNSAETSSICFNKKDTHDFLKLHNFNIAKAVYCHHELFWAERNHQELKDNPYKKYIFKQIEKLPLPLIIKDTSGLSSYGMEVCTTYNQAIGILNSKKNNGDKLIEEFIPGLQFGTEIHGTKDGDYTIFDPFLFSVNQYGITSPKQSIKLGPVTSKDFNLPELKNELLRLAQLLDINGIAQVDLIFNQGKWYIVEINPRLSGMTNSIIASQENGLVMALKLPILSDKEIEELKNFDFILKISQVINDAAKQRRECGYCEIIFKLDKNKTQLYALKDKIPHLIDEGFYKQALEMCKTIGL